MKISRTFKKVLLVTVTLIIFVSLVKVFFLDIYTIINEESKIQQRVLVLKTKSVDKNDLVLVENLFAENMFVSRIVAFGGDTVKISDGDLYVNNILQKNNIVTYNYRINAFSENASLLLKEKYKLIDQQNILGVYFLNLKEKIVDSLNNDSVFIIRKEVVEKGISNKKIFPQSYMFRWNEDNFGPLNIKKNGDLINLNKTNYNLYKNTIKVYEKVPIEQKDENILVNNEKKQKYEFKKEYFFCINDNRSNYNDSRVLGMMPMEVIKGKVLKIF